MSRWRQIVPLAILTACRVIGVSAIVWLVMTQSETSGLNDSPVLAWIVVVLGFAATISMSLSSLSFLLYAIEYVFYWERVIRVASHHDDLEPFTRDLGRRGLLSGAGSPRVGRN